MKIETLMFDTLKKLIPEGTSKTILFANVEETSYEVFFYCAFSDGKFHQCYTMAEKGVIDAYLLDLSFSKIAENIRSDKKYKEDKSNVYTFVVDNTGVHLDVEYYEKDANQYKIIKMWKEKYII